MAVTVKCYQDLEAWKKSVGLVEAVYRITENFPGKEAFGLTNQVRRAVVSIPSNIAEGSGRDHSKEFLQFLAVSRGSLREVETQLIIAEKLGYLSKSDLRGLLDKTDEISRIISGLINSIRRKLAAKTSPLATRHSPLRKET